MNTPIKSPRTDLFAFVADFSPNVLLLFVAFFSCDICQGEKLKLSPSAEPLSSVVYGEPITSGFIIVGGQVIEPPFRVGFHNRVVYVNGIAVAALPNEGANPIQPLELIGELEFQLSLDSAFIVFDQRTRLMSDIESSRDLLKNLSEAASLPKKVELAFAAASAIDNPEISKRISTAQWRLALADFETSDEMRRFIDDNRDAIINTDDQSFDEVATEIEEASQDRSRWMYVCNIAGMILVVLSAGTLMRQWPAKDMAHSDSVEDPQTKLYAAKLSGLIVSLSAFDLCCTLLTNATGTFEELNPFAALILGSPFVLAAFKVAATTMGVAILWTLRKYAAAQTAIWWMCLVLTLVTARWVAVQSLFYV